MIEYVTKIKSFWDLDLQNHTYARTVPFVAKNFDHLDKKYYSQGHILQSFNEELGDPSQFCKSLSVENNASVSWTCIEPNVILPIHSDSFYTLRTANDVSLENCYRYLVFLEDYVFGQYVGFESCNIRDWKKGDVWKFDGSERHFAANASNHRFHTCQISTFK